MASLAATFGRGAMTNHWKDIKNADVVLVMGANPAENHPCGFKWALEARDNRGAKLLTIDPRFTRTSAVADRHLQIRPGSDIAILGGLIRFALVNDLHHADYVRLHTNASFIVGEEFGFADGLFAGFDETANRYDKTAWEYERGPDGFVRRDPTLTDPRCVFQLLMQHYDRYTPNVAADIAGCSEADFLEMAEIICSTGTADRVGTIMYAVGWTMHTVGSQIIRTAAILQLLGLKDQQVRGALEHRVEQLFGDPIAKLLGQKRLSRARKKNAELPPGLPCPPPLSVDMQPVRIGAVLSDFEK